MCLMDTYLTFTGRIDMGKTKVTAETILDKCTVYGCTYNDKGFCHLASIMLGDDGSCIYRKERADGKTQDNVG